MSPRHRSTVVALLAVLLAAPGNALQAQNPWENEIQQLTAGDKKKMPPKGGIVFVGSSSIRLWKTLQTDFPGYNVINRGFGGSQLIDSVTFAKRIVTPYKPQMVVLFAGTNDLASGKTPETVTADFKEFVRVVRAELPKARIAYIAVTPAPSRWGNIANVKRTNWLIRNECVNGDNLAFIDTVPWLTTEDGGPRPELFVSDQLHMNAAGYAIWKQVVGPFLPWGVKGAKVKR